ncbi:helix-turn-helix transcriptional regulator [Nocardiopsis sp. RSe5-2]|uniref:Helix-turn-helix transcriptional regulator n=1 Tax=Nocardiopsis endophytica TaxID=3018445 RepID=A0ABT4U5M4_9ACTN|nr:helix-turn-helix transcriptional regulator [Nocardiopsis endophytica]MDA2812016.1 helix-turn-helix transcriptional regulator [Nocardiopsis endophytica]
MPSKVKREWTRFGAEVKKLREKSGFTQVRVQSETGISASMLSSIENATRAPKRNHADILDRVFAAEGVLIRIWLDVNDTAFMPDWWRDIGLLEREAVEIREYQMLIIPGVLQTEAYARAVIRPGRPWDSQEAVERDVEARLERWNRLRGEVLLWFVVDEYTLTRVVESRETMGGQLDHVARLIDEARIRLQVIPQPKVYHPGMSGALRLLDFKDRSPVALVEHLAGEEIIHDSDRVRHLRTLYGALQGEALSLEESAHVLRKIRKDYRDE